MSRRRHPASRATHITEIVDRELQQLVEGGHTLGPTTETDMTPDSEEEI